MPPPAFKTKKGSGIKMMNVVAGEAEKLKEENDKIREAAYNPKADMTNIVYTKA